MTTADLIERALADLPATIRTRRGPMSYRQAASQAGVSHSLLFKLEAGRLPNVSAARLAKVLRWATPVTPNKCGQSDTLVARGSRRRGAERSVQ